MAKVHHLGEKKTRTRPTPPFGIVYHQQCQVKFVYKSYKPSLYIWIEGVK